jgi:pyruvate carboxylase
MCLFCQWLMSANGLYVCSTCAVNAFVREAKQSGVDIFRWGPKNRRTLLIL